MFGETASFQTQQRLTVRALSPKSSDNSFRQFAPLSCVVICDPTQHKFPATKAAAHSETLCSEKVISSLGTHSSFPRNSTESGDAALQDA